MEENKENMKDDEDDEELFENIIFILKPGIDNDPEKCPTFTTDTFNAFMDLAKWIADKYKCDFIYMQSDDLNDCGNLEDGGGEIFEE